MSRSSAPEQRGKCLSPANNIFRQCLGTSDIDKPLPKTPTSAYTQTY